MKPNDYQERIARFFIKGKTHYLNFEKEQHFPLAETKDRIETRIGF